jgi:hypothetical protein
VSKIHAKLWITDMKSKTILLASLLSTSFSNLSPAIADEYFELLADHSHRCAQVNSSSKANGANITQWHCVVQPNMFWRKLNAGNGFFKLQAKHSGKCAQVDRASQEDGANITQWDCVDQDNVLWKQVSAGENSYYIVNKASGKCMHVDGSSEEDLGNISQGKCQNQLNFKWQFAGPPHRVD